jgi:hypothetical protein
MLNQRLCCHLFVIFRTHTIVFRALAMGKAPVFSEQQVGEK